MFCPWSQSVFHLMSSANLVRYHFPVSWVCCPLNCALSFSTISWMFCPLNCALSFSTISWTFCPLNQFAVLLMRSASLFSVIFHADLLVLSPGRAFKTHPAGRAAAGSDSAPQELSVWPADRKIHKDYKTYQVWCGSAAAKRFVTLLLPLHTSSGSCARVSVCLLLASVAPEFGLLWSLVKLSEKNAFLGSDVAGRCSLDSWFPTECSELYTCFSW